jgi:hypothetical protein
MPPHHPNAPPPDFLVWGLPWNCRKRTSKHPPQELGWIQSASGLRYKLSHAVHRVIPIVFLLPISSLSSSPTQHTLLSPISDPWLVHQQCIMMLCQKESFLFWTPTCTNSRCSAPSWSICPTFVSQLAWSFPRMVHWLVRPAVTYAFTNRTAQMKLTRGAYKWLQLQISSTRCVVSQGLMLS